MKHRKIFPIFAVLMALCLLLTACGTTTTTDESVAPAEEATSSDAGKAVEEAAAASTKDTLVVAIPSDPGSLDFNNNIEGYNGLVFGQMGETLVTTDDEGAVVPYLAESFEYLDDTTIAFYLRKGVKFHNGEELTSEDVEYTFQRCAAHPVLSTEITNIDVENSYCEDEYTYVMKLFNVSAPLLYTLALDPFCIVNKDYCESVDETVIASEPVGTGPYEFVSWDVGTAVTLKAYDGYWDADNAAKIKNLTFKVIAEAANRTIELETGNVDLALDIQVTDTSIIESNDDLSLLVGEGTGVTFGLINQRREPFNNIDVRLALVKAIDRESLCNAIYDEYGTVPNSVYAATLFGYDDTYAAANYGYDPDAAKELLAGAGYDDSNPLFVDIVVSQSGNASACAEIISNMWSQIGIQSEIHEYEAGTFFEYFANFDYDFSIATQTATSPDPDPVTYVIFSGSGMGLWSSDETDELLELERVSTDVEARQDAFVKFQQICQEKVAAAPLLTASIISACNKDLAGIPNYTYIGNNMRYNTFYWAN